MKEILKIKFVDHYEGFDPEKNFFWDLLSVKYDLQLSEQPEIMIYTSFGRSHINFKCLKIYWTGENRRPNFNQCDFAFTFDEHSPDGKNYRLPLYTRAGLGSSDREQGFISGKLPWVKIHAAACFCDSVLK